MPPFGLGRRPSLSSKDRSHHHHNHGGHRQSPTPAAGAASSIPERLVGGAASSSTYTTTTEPLQSTMSRSSDVVVISKATGHVGGGSGGGGGGPGSINGGGGGGSTLSNTTTSLSAEDRIINALMNRLIANLPMTTGKRLNELESDDALLQCIEAIKELARRRLAMVVASLVTLLERYIRLDHSTTATSPPAVYVWESEVIILKALSSAFNARWKSCAQETHQISSPSSSSPPSPWPAPPPVANLHTERLLNVLLHYVKLFTIETPVPSNSSSTSSVGGAGMTALRGAYRTGVPAQSALRRVHMPVGNHDHDSYDVGLRYRAWPTTVDMSEPAARIGLAGVGTSGSIDVPPHSNSGHGRISSDSRSSKDLRGGAAVATSSSSSPHHSRNQASQSSTGQTSKGGNEPDDVILDHLVRQVGRILFALSTSQWDEVWSYLRRGLRSLSGSSAHDAQHTFDHLQFSMIEWLNLDRSRLTTVIKELGSQWLHLRQAAHQISLGKNLWLAIWNYIEAYPADFAQVIEREQKVDGADLLFDVVANSASGSDAKRQRLMWPLQAMLMILCPSQFRKALMTESGGTTNKKTSFITDLRKSVGNSRADIMAWQSQCDVVRAASLLPPTAEESPLRQLAQEVAQDVGNAIGSELASTDLHRTLLCNESCASFKRLRRYGPVMLMPAFANRRLTSTQTLDLAGMVLLAVEDDRSRWLGLSMDRMDETTARAIRQLFIETLKVLVSVDAKDLTARSGSEYGTHKLIFNSICTLYSLAPAVAFIGATRTPATRSTYNDKPYPAGLFEESPQAEIRDDGVVQLLLRLGIAMDGSTIGIGIKIAIGRLLVLLQQWVVDLAFDDADGLALKRSLYFASPHLAGQIFPALVRLGHSNESLESRQAVVAVAVEQFRITETVFMTMSEACGLPSSVDQMSLSRAAGDAAMTALYPAHQEFVLKSVGKMADIVTCSWDNRPESAHELQRIRLYKGIRQLGMDQKGYVYKRKQLRANLTQSLGNLGSVSKTMWLLLVDWFERLVEDLLNGRSSHGVTDARLAATIQTVAFTLSACSDCLTNATVLFSFNVKRDVDPHQMLVTLVERLVDLLVADAVELQEAAREALGSSTAQAVPIVLDQMHDLLQHAFSNQGIDVSNVFTTFADNAGASLRLLAERQASEVLLGPASNAKLGAVLTLLGRYIEQMPDGTVAVRSRHNFVKTLHLTGSTIAKSQAGAAELTALLHRWLQEALDFQATALKAELLEAIDALLSSDNASQASSADDVARQSALYLDCFTTGAPTTSDQTTALAARALTSLARQNPVRAVPTLLALSTSYPESAQVIILQTLQTVLQEGHLGVLPNDPAANTAITPIRTAVATNLPLALALCSAAPISESENIVNLLYRIWRERGMLRDNLKALLREEVSKTDTQTQLFRSNSSATRMMILVTRNDGYGYFRHILQPFFKALQETGLGREETLNGDVGLDPDRRGRWLESVICLLLDTILHSKALPDRLQRWYSLVYEVTISRFPAAGSVGVASFYFLRLLCPSIINPERLDIQVPLEYRRSLVTVSKCLINIASKQLFPASDLDHVVLNEIIERYTPLVAEYMEATGLRVADAPIEDSVRASGSSHEVAAEEDYLGWLLRRDDVRQSIPPSILGEISIPRADMQEARRTRMQQYLDANRAVDTSAFGSVFFEGSPALGSPSRTFYLNWRADLDGSYLILHILRHIADVQDAFNVIVNNADSGLDADIEILALIRGLTRYITADLIKRAKIALFQPGFAAVEAIRTACNLFRVNFDSTLRAHISAVSSPSQLAKVIPYQHLDLYERDVKDISSATYMLKALTLEVEHRQIPVVAYIFDKGDRSVLVCSRDKVELWPSSMSSELIARLDSRTIATSVLQRFGGDDANRLASFFKSRSGPVGTTPRTATEKPLQASLIGAGLLHSQNVRNAQIRQQGLALLSAVTEFLNLQVPSKYFRRQDNDNLLDNVKMVLDLAARMARSCRDLQLDVALEMLTVVLPSAAGQQRAACVRLLLPWLDVLREESFSIGREHAIRNVIRALLELSASDNDVWPSWLEPIWSYLSTCATSIQPLVLSEVLAVLAQNHQGLEKSLQIHMWEHRGITARASSQLRKAITSTFTLPTASLAAHTTWPNIRALVHLLAAILGRSTLPKSETGNIEAHLAMPDIVYAVVMLAGCGTDDVQQSIRAVVRKLGDLFGDASSSTHIEAIQLAIGKLSGAKEMDMASLRHLKDLIVAWMRLLTLAAPTEETRNVWFTRLSSLIISTCFQYNPPVQTRAAVFLGCLIAQDTAPVEDDLIYQLSMAVHLALRRNDATAMLLHALLSTLQIAAGRPTAETRYSPEMVFWWGIRLFETDRVVLDGPALSLLAIAVERLKASHAQEDIALWEDRGEHDLLDHTFGLNFDDKLLAAFSITALLVRVRRQSDLSQQGQDVARYLLGVCQDSATSKISGCGIPFFVYLHFEATSRMTANGDQPSSLINDHLRIDNEITAILIAALLAQLLHESESDERSLRLLGAIRDLCEAWPSAAPSLRSFCAPSLISIVQGTSHTDLLASVMRLLAEGDATDESDDQTGESKLRDMGMEALLPGGARAPKDRDSPNLMELAAAAFSM